MSRVGYAFRLRQHADGNRGCIYSPEFGRAERTEFQKWLDNEKIRSHSEFEGLAGAVNAIPDQGVPDEYFFKQKGYNNSGRVQPLMKNKKLPELRLYCVNPPSKRWLIIGNGCVKDEGGRISDYPKCHMSFKDIRYVYERVHDRVNQSSKHVLRSTTEALVGEREFGSKPSFSFNN